LKEFCRLQNVFFELSQQVAVLVCLSQVLNLAQLGRQEQLQEDGPLSDDMSRLASC
jgi:hypothetical protein